MLNAYDVFISYSSRDADWVRTWLLPRLESNGLRVCIDFRDFDVGVPALFNMENAVECSNKTLLVLTPSWVASEWTNFESLLVQTQDPIGRRRRLIPLLRERCGLPSRLGIFTYADFTDSTKWDWQLARVISQINPSATPPPVPQPPAPNPFVDTGRIDDPAQFFDREKETERIFDALARNNCVSIVGDSKMGKSSLLYQIAKQGATKISAQFAYLTLERVTSGSSFYELACRALGGTGTCNRDLGRLIDSGHRKIFCLDEMEKLCCGYGNDIRSFLRGYADGANAPLKLVTASRQLLAQLFPDNAGKTSPLYNIFTDIITLANFSRADCERFLDARVANTGVSFDPATRDEIWTLTQGHPYKLQRAAHHCYAAANDPTYDWRARFREDALLVK